jgi:DNA-binding NtrC family response regulator
VLRALGFGEYMAVARKGLGSDVRIIAAPTAHGGNGSPGFFSPGFFLSDHVLPLFTPLRERKEDIPLLGSISDSTGRSGRMPSRDLTSVMENDWPVSQGIT